MSTHAHVRLTKLWHHGVAERVARELPVPVLLVHPRSEEEAPELTRVGRIRHILVPLDGSRYADAMVPHALDLAEPFGATFTLLNVVRPEFTVGYTLLGQDGHVNHHRLDRASTVAQSHLEHVAAEIRDRGFETRTRIEVGGDAASAIVGYARRSLATREPVDIISMETHPHRPISRILGRHTADAVIHESPVPVLLFEPTPRIPLPEETSRRAVSRSA